MAIWQADDQDPVDEFGQFFDALPKRAHALVDIVSGAARLGALLGNRVLCLIQSDDPRMDVGAIGGLEPQGNPSEWRNADRGL